MSTEDSKTQKPLLENHLKDLESKIPDEITSYESNNPINSPSFSAKNSGENQVDIKLLSEVFKKIEEETTEIAEQLFDYLINLEDEQLFTGTIPYVENRRINNYIKILNRLFLFSKNYSKNTGIKIVNRRVVKELDRKTFAFSMCLDGGTSLDILCNIVNEENQARTPKNSPVKVTVKQLSNRHAERNL